MITTNNIWVSLVEVVPLYASLTMIFLLLLALRDSKTNIERGVKMSFLLYLGAFTAGDLLLALYTYQPAIYVYFSPLTMATFMFTPVLFYRLLWMLTYTGRKEPFPGMWHFALPVFLTLTLIVWSVFTPLSVQLDLVMKREVSFDYQLFSLLFKSKLLVGSVSVFTYIVLSLVRLVNYYRSMNHGAKPCKCPTQLKLFIAVLLLMLSLVSGVLLITLRNGVMNSLLPIALLLIVFVVLHSIMGYNIICRRFVFYLLPTQEEKTGKRKNRKRESLSAMPIRTLRQIAERVENTKGQVVTVALTRQRFEDYFRERKPHLNPELKITDLIEPLKANRSVISNFVNKTYGVNFNRYINHLRLKELEQLKNAPSNKGKKIGHLHMRAGFASMRNYTRAIAAERDNQPSES